jgi:hypothetical protein
MSSTFDIKALGAAIAKALGLQQNDEVELQRDRLDANRILIIRHRAVSGESKQ